MTEDRQTNNGLVAPVEESAVQALAQESEGQPEKPKAKPVRRKVGAKKPAVRKTARGKAAASRTRKPAAASSLAKFPRNTLKRALRIPQAILDQNAGNPCSQADAAKYLGGKATGAFSLEVSSAKKYGFLETVSGKLGVTDRAKRALRPQADTDELSALREAVLDAPDISAVYNYYRGEYLPDDNFFRNALVDTFKVPADKLSDFLEIFNDCMRTAKLVDESNDRRKLIDIGREESTRSDGGVSVVARKAAAVATATDASCFVMQPFAPPYADYYESLFKPAIEQAGLRPVRADDEIFGSGKIMDQVWRGIQDARVLIAELTTRNANVYYELGLAHALGKPVVLIAEKGENVPFDLQHIRVIYYDTSDPFWGNKLIDKIAENVDSALVNPEEAVLSIG